MPESQINASEFYQCLVRAVWREHLIENAGLPQLPFLLFMLPSCHSSAAPSVPLALCGCLTYTFYSFHGSLYSEGTSTSSAPKHAVVDRWR